MWRIENLVADNDPAYPTLAMRISADAVAFYNPSTKCMEGETIGGSAIKDLQCAINGCGPDFKDQSTPYVAGNVPWFYLIFHPTLGISTLNSLIGPSQTNSCGSTGPILPSGYTSYCPCFPLILVGSATLQPLGPQSGITNIQVRGNEVQYPNRPLIVGSGYPVMNFDLSAWVPTGALETGFIADAEIHSYAGGGVIAGAVLGTPAGNFENISLYPSGPSVWSAADVTTWVPLSQTAQKFACTFMCSGGVIDNAVCCIFIIGYIFHSS
jgi:hypothetical protein